MAVIKVEKLKFSYNKMEPDLTLNNINFTFEPGFFYVITGPNGSGKTTFLNCLNGFLVPNEGAVLINGKNISDLPVLDLAKFISLVPQNTTISFDFTVQEIVEMSRYPYLRRFQEMSKEDMEIVESAMLETGVYDFRGRNINSISGGEMQRVIIARSIAQRTPIMLLDEPISMLDIYYQISIMDTIKRIVRRNKTTAIAVLHDLNIASRYADYILLFDNGKIYSSGTPEEVYTKENLKNVYNIDFKIIKDLESGYLNIQPK